MLDSPMLMLQQRRNFGAEGERDYKTPN